MHLELQETRDVVNTRYVVVVNYGSTHYICDQLYLDKKDALKRALDIVSNMVNFNVDFSRGAGVTSINELTTGDTNDIVGYFLEKSRSAVVKTTKVRF